MIGLTDVNEFNTYLAMIGEERDVYSELYGNLLFPRRPGIEERITELKLNNTLLYNISKMDHESIKYLLPLK